MRNPFLKPLWLTCAIGLIVSFSIDIPLTTLWGLTAWIPWLVMFIALITWERRHPV